MEARFHHPKSMGSAGIVSQISQDYFSVTFCLCFQSKSSSNLENESDLRENDPVKRTHIRMNCFDTAKKGNLEMAYIKVWVRTLRESVIM